MYTQDEIKTLIQKDVIVASGTDTYTASVSPIIASYPSFLKLFVKFTNANTTTATLNINGIGAKTIKKNVTSDLVTGDISAGQILALSYDGTNFQIVGSVSTGGGGGGSSTAGNLLFLYYNFK